MPTITKTKLKVITLEVKQTEPYKWQYTAIDDNGKRLHSRSATRARNGKLYQCALITKNRNHLYAYSMKMLFTSMERVVLSTPDSPAKKNCKPYALAIVPEVKHAYGEWIEIK